MDLCINPGNILDHNASTEVLLVTHFTKVIRSPLSGFEIWLLVEYSNVLILVVLFHLSFYLKFSCISICLQYTMVMFILRSWYMCCKMLSLGKFFKATDLLTLFHILMYVSLFLSIQFQIFHYTNRKWAYASFISMIHFVQCY